MHSDHRKLLSPTRYHYSTFQSGSRGGIRTHEAFRRDLMRVPVLTTYLPGHNQKSAIAAVLSRAHAPEPTFLSSVFPMVGCYPHCLHPQNLNAETTHDLVLPTWSYCGFVVLTTGFAHPSPNQRVLQQRTSSSHRLYGDQRRFTLFKKF